MPDNILLTRLEIDEASYKTQLQSSYVNPSKKAAKETEAAFVESNKTLVNAGRESLKRISDFSKGINPKPTFAEDYKKAFDNISQRADTARRNVQKFIEIKAGKGQFDVTLQGAIVAEKRINELSLSIRNLRKEAAKPENQTYFKTLRGDIINAEQELERLERKQKNFRQGGGGLLPTGSGGNTGGGSNGFGNLYLAGQLAGTVPGLGTIAGGAIVAGPAGAAVAAIIEGIRVTEELAAVTVDLTEKSIQEAANFEEVTNSLAVYTGGISGAKAELIEFDRIAIETNGLRLESAEKGYQRLRALGFEAKTAGDLVKGIGIQRLLSGANEQDVGRVITNLV